MDPTSRSPDSPRTSLGLAKLDLSAEGVGLEDAAIFGQCASGYGRHLDRARNKTFPLLLFEVTEEVGTQDGRLWLVGVGEDRVMAITDDGT